VKHVPAAIRREQASPAAMEAAVGLAPLDALIPASRSAPNRATLVAAGTLPALAAILDAGISRLNTLAAILGELVSEDQLYSLLC